MKQPPFGRHPMQRSFRQFKVADAITKNDGSTLWRLRFCTIEYAAACNRKREMMYAKIAQSLSHVAAVQQ